MIFYYTLNIRYCDISKKKIDNIECACATTNVQRSIKDISDYYQNLYDWVIIDCDAEIQIWKSIKLTILGFIFKFDWIRNKFTKIEKD